MRTWPVEEAQARFTALFEACLRDGPQFVSREGTTVAVLVPIADWQQVTKPTLKELLLTDWARGDLQIPPRGRLRRRRPIKPVETD